MEVSSLENCKNLKFYNFYHLARGKASSSSSGLITTLIDQASKLHPNNPAPCVIVENSDTQVLISKYGQLTSAVYKHK
jgi:hypothetical protein